MSPPKRPTRATAVPGVAPSVTLRARASAGGQEILGISPNARGDVVVATFAFVPHHRGGDVVRFRREGRTWHRRRLRSGAAYHGEALAVAFAAERDAFAYGYWDDDRVAVEIWDVRGARPRLDVSLPMPRGGGEGQFPERMALALHPDGDSAVAAVLTRDNATSRERALVFHVSAESARPLRLEKGFTPTGLAFVGPARTLLLIGADGTLLARDPSGEHALGRARLSRHPEDGMALLMHARGDEVLIGNDRRLITVCVDPAPREVAQQTVPFVPAEARFGPRGVVAIRCRGHHLERWEPERGSVLREMPGDLGEVALGEDSTTLFEGRAESVAIWPLARWRKLPAVDAAASVASLVENGASVAEILAQTAPASAADCRRVLDRILAVARAQKPVWNYYDVARDVAEQRAEIALAEGRLADAHADLTFAVAMYLTRDKKCRAAVARAAEVRARLRAEPATSGLTEDIPTDHLIGFLELRNAKDGRVFVESAVRGYLAADLPYSGAFHLLCGLAVGLRLLAEIGRGISLTPERLAKLRVVRADAEKHLRAAIERHPRSALPWFWLHNLHRAASVRALTEPELAEAARRECAARLDDPEADGPAPVAGFLDRQAANPDAMWNHEAKNWRSKMAALRRGK